MTPTFQLSTREFAKDMQEVMRVRKKDGASILNRAGRNVSFRAQKETPKANSSRIRSDLNKRVSINGRSVKILYPLAIKWARENGFTGKLNQGLIVEIVRLFGKRRVTSGKYIAAGWFKVAADFGASVRRYSEKGLAGQSTGTKATPQRLLAVLENAARGAGIVGGPALQRAINFVGAEMVKYAREEFAKSDRKLSK